MDKKIHLEKLFLKVEKIFSQASLALKNHPAFNEILEGIKISIEVRETNPDFEASNFDIKIEDDKIIIYQYTSCFGNTPHTLKYNNRFNGIIEIFLNEKGELVYRDSTGEFLPKFENDIQTATTVSYSFLQFIYAKDSNQIISMMTIHSSKKEVPQVEKIRTLPWKEMPLINNNVKGIEEYKKYDEETIKQIYLHMPKIENTEVTEMPEGLENYIVWISNLNYPDFTKGNVKEWINSIDGKKIVIKNFSDIDASMINNHLYASKGYTGEEIINIIKNISKKD